MLKTKIGLASKRCSVIFFLLAATMAQGHSAMQSDDGPEFKAARPGPQCAWVPQREYQGSLRCGMNDLGLPARATFECGMVNTGSKCERRCRFVECSPE